MELDIDRELYEILSRRAAGNGFGSAEEYSKEILEIVVQELESQTELRQEESVSDEETVTDRLEDLGYLE
jgi:DNA-binding protein H-NS